VPNQRKEVYKGPYLTIYFDKAKDRFVQFWNTPVNQMDSFKKEMLIYTSFYEQHRPTQTLWLQEKFILNLDNEAFNWIETHVNIPCAEYGNKKAAFVVGKDVLSHLTVIDSFEKEHSIINVSHFASEKEAEDWLDETPSPLRGSIKTAITYEGIDRDGNSIIKVKRASQDITKTIKSFKDLIDENDFIKKNIDSYSSLTKRENEVLALYATGQSYKEISELLFISVFTVKTHWRNIKKKLKINSFNDVIKYTKSFDLN